MYDRRSVEGMIQDIMAASLISRTHGIRDCRCNARVMYSPKMGRTWAETMRTAGKRGAWRNATRRIAVDDCGTTMVILGSVLIWGAFTGGVIDAFEMLTASPPCGDSGERAAANSRRPGEFISLESAL